MRAIITVAGTRVWCSSNRYRFCFAEAVLLLFLTFDHTPSCYALWLPRPTAGVRHKDRSLFLPHYSTNDAPSTGSLQLTEAVGLDFSGSDVPDASFLLPIFPLRKRVRFPTDELTLNLYEDRYLAMSEFILFPECNGQKLYEIDTQIQPLSAAAPFFGALYSLNKPQIITQGGTAPIVPMLQPGDVGVLCLVLDWLDGMIPTTAATRSPAGDMDDADIGSSSSVLKDAGTRRRIRLNALGVGRFQIKSIVHDGTLVNGKPPFLLAEASIVMDESEGSFDTQEFERLQQALEGIVFPKPVATKFATNESSLHDSVRLLDQIASLVEYAHNPDMQRHELLSFQAASIFTEQSATSSPKDMLNLLKTRSLQTRMNILQSYKRW